MQECQMARITAFPWFTMATHMKKLPSILFLVIVCSLSLFAQDKTKKEKICITEQEYEVYELLGIGNYKSETTSYPFSEHVEIQLPNISSGVVADYKEKNSRPYLLRCILRKDQKKKKLKTFYGTTTDVGFSRVGFNKDETEALVYFSWSSPGNNCGTQFVYLNKEHDKWKIVKRVTMVIC